MFILLKHGSVRTTVIALHEGKYVVVALQSITRLVVTFELLITINAVSFIGAIEVRHVLPASPALVHRAIECEISGTGSLVKANTVELSLFVADWSPVNLCHYGYLKATVAVRYVFRHSAHISSGVIVVVASGAYE